MEILLLGASGLVGSAVARQGAAAAHVIAGTVGKWNDGMVPGLAHQARVDLRDADALERLAGTGAGRLFVNAAAVADPGACDADPRLSQRLNVELPAQLARLARAGGARFVHLSSEQVFDGAQPPYAVGSPVHAINLYARQKIEAEQRVALADPAAVILRLPLLLGNSLTGRRSVHERLLEMWAAGREARLYVDEIRQPCTADSVARAILEIAAQPGLRGVFHWAGTDSLSRFDLACKIRERFGLSEQQARLVPVSRKDDPNALKSRPASLELDLAPLATLLPTKPQSLAEALAELRPPAWWQGA